MKNREKLDAMKAKRRGRRKRKKPAISPGGTENRRNPAGVGGTVRSGEGAEDEGLNKGREPMEGSQ